MPIVYGRLPARNQRKSRTRRAAYGSCGRPAPEVGAPGSEAGSAMRRGAGSRGGGISVAGDHSRGRTARTGPANANRPGNLPGLIAVVTEFSTGHPAEPIPALTSFSSRSSWHRSWLSSTSWLSWLPCPDTPTMDPDTRDWKLRSGPLRHPTRELTVHKHSHVINMSSTASEPGLGVMFIGAYIEFCRGRQSQLIVNE